MKKKFNVSIETSFNVYVDIDSEEFKRTFEIYKSLYDEYSTIEELVKSVVYSILKGNGGAIECIDPVSVNKNLLFGEKWNGIDVDAEFDCSDHIVFDDVDIEEEEIYSRFGK